jgi:hypothetical protein
MMAELRLVSPANEWIGRQICAPRPQLDAPISVLLIDSMLNPKAGWGQSVLDGVEQVLASPNRSFERLMRTPRGDQTPPEIWAQRFAGRVQLAAAAVGD